MVLPQIDKDGDEAIDIEAVGQPPIIQSGSTSQQPGSTSQPGSAIPSASTTQPDSTTLPASNHPIQSEFIRKNVQFPKVGLKSLDIGIGTCYEHRRALISNKILPVMISQ